MKKVKCRFCGQIVSVLPNGNVKPHLNGGQVQCVGNGQRATLSKEIK